jgi:hypothetical protein
MDISSALTILQESQNAIRKVRVTSHPVSRQAEVDR